MPDDPRPHADRVLEWLNEQRATYNIGEPLSAVPPDVQHNDVCELSAICPIAQGLGAYCGRRVAYVGEHKLYFPDFVTEFILDHDQRRQEARSGRP